MNTCIEKHTSCNEHSSDSERWPTRLLAMGDLARKNSVRLIHTASEKPLGPYVALCHRWGSTQFLKLLSGNLKEFCEGVPISSLPRTFRDAITVARWLNVSYLWIDSLCIYFDRSRMKYRRNLRFEPLYSKGLHFVLEVFFIQILTRPHQKHQKPNKQTQTISASNKFNEPLYINTYWQALTVRQ